MKRYGLRFGVWLGVLALCLGALSYLHPAYAHLLVGEARVLARDRSVSLVWDTPVHPYAEVYRTLGPREQLVLWVSTSQLSPCTVIILIDPGTWALSVPNPGPSAYARLFPSWLVQAESGRLGVLPGKLEWSPQLQVQGSGVSFVLPEFAFRSATRVSVRVAGAS